MKTLKKKASTKTVVANWCKCKSATSSQCKQIGMGRMALGTANTKQTAV